MCKSLYQLIFKKEEFSLWVVPVFNMRVLVFYSPHVFRGVTQYLCGFPNTHKFALRKVQRLGFLQSLQHYFCDLTD